MKFYGKFQQLEWFAIKYSFTVIPGEAGFKTDLFQIRNNN